MEWLANSVLVVLLLSNLALLVGRSLSQSLRVLAVQGLALGAAVVLLSPDPGLSTVLLAVGVAALKGALYPWALARVLRRVKAPAHDEPLLGDSATLVVGLLTIAASFAAAPALAPPGEQGGDLALAVALSTMVAGLTLTITRRTALTQVLGYVVLENGIFLFALILVGGLPLLLELGGLLEVFFAVFVMGIAVDRISRELSSIDVDGLDRLRG